MGAYTLISSGVIIAKLYRDLNLQDPHWEVDALEWIAEALEHIGAYPTLEDRNATLEIVEHKAELPPDLMILKAVYYSPKATLDTWNDATKYPMRKSDATAFQGSNDDFHQTYDFDPGYQINGGYIHIDDESGVVGIAYKGLPIDDDGYPLVPGNISFKEAMEWYIMKQMMMGGFRHPDSTFNYNFCDQKWRFYCSQARNSAVFPDVEDMENFKQNWVRLVNLRDRHSHFFEDDIEDRFSLYGNEHLKDKL